MAQLLPFLPCAQVQVSQQAYEFLEMHALELERTMESFGMPLCAILLLLFNPALSMLVSPWHNMRMEGCPAASMCK